MITESFENFLVSKTFQLLRASIPAVEKGMFITESLFPLSKVLFVRPLLFYYRFDSVGFAVKDKINKI